VFFETVSEHRALMVLRGEDLDDDIGDTDPQETGVPPLDPDRSPHQESKTAEKVKNILTQIKDVLSDESKANMVLSRGFAKLPDLPNFEERYKLKPAAIAGYPMYRGVSRLLGIDVYSQPTSAEDICKETVKALDEDFTFIFSHFKYPDKTGEDGDIEAKVAVIEEMDKALPILLNKPPDALIITGDHSTPAPLASHSWHPVPTLIKAPFLRGPFMDSFKEKSCLQGEFGTFYAKEMLPIAMAHTLKLEKYGA
jgi:2,3-bisphosphoglycerate-independent phosphoglycerate mutase